MPAARRLWSRLHPMFWKVYVGFSLFPNNPFIWTQTIPWCACVFLTSFNKKNGHSQTQTSSVVEDFLNFKPTKIDVLEVCCGWKKSTPPPKKKSYNNICSENWWLEDAWKMIPFLSHIVSPRFHLVSRSLWFIGWPWFFPQTPWQRCRGHSVKWRENDERQRVQTAGMEEIWGWPRRWFCYFFLCFLLVCLHVKQLKLNLTETSDVCSETTSIILLWNQMLRVGNIYCIPPISPWMWPCFT